MSINLTSIIPDEQQNLQLIPPSFSRELQIDSEFQNLIPPLTVEEKLQDETGY